MNISGLPWFFGVFLIIFVIGAGLSVWVARSSKGRQQIVFGGLCLLSLIFVLSFIIFGWRRSDLRLAEIGQYYPLGTISAQPMLSIGDASHQPDYVVGDCHSSPYFCGRVDFYLERKPNAPNKLTWRLYDVDGIVSVNEVSSSAFKETLDWALGMMPKRTGLRPGHTDGAAGIDLSGNTKQLVIKWEPSASNSAATPFSLPLIIELNPTDSPSRVTVEHAQPYIVELPEQSNGRTSADADTNPAGVYLTSSDQSVALRGKGGQEYVATIRVGQADPSSRVNAYLEMSRHSSETNEFFIVNNGLHRTGNSFGSRVYIGAERGIVATVITSSGSQWRYVVAVLLLWLLVFGFFIWYVPLNGGLFAFIPSVQMLLAVRFVLSLRAYLWSPNSAVAIESAVLALLLVPLLLFIGCYAIGLREIGYQSERDSWEKRWWRYLYKDFPPFWYWVSAMIFFLAVWIYLRPSATEIATTRVMAFYQWGQFAKSFALLLLIPPLIWRIGIKLDRQLRSKRESDPSADAIYNDGGYDPITYWITKANYSSATDQTWTQSCTLYLLLVLIIGALLFIVFKFAPASGAGLSLALSQFLLGVLAVLESVVLLLLSKELRKESITGSVAAKYVAIVLLSVSALVGLRAGLAFAGIRSVPEALPIISARTNMVFELLILVLTLRLLTAFLDRWSDVNAQFGIRGFAEAAIILFAPVLMYFASLLASHDTGAMVVHVPALIGAVLIVTGLWPLWKARYAGIKNAIWALLMVAALVLVYIFGIYTKAPLLVAGPHSTVAQRVLLREGAIAASGSAETGGLEFLGAIEQTWRMTNYVAEGGWKGRGFGGAPMISSRKFQRITLDDLVFSVYVLSEHGALGGFALLSLYALILWLALRMAWRSLRDDPDDPLRIALVGGLILAVVFPAFYMAAANVNQLIFTGQNLPLLNLRSHSEILRTALMLMLLVAAVKPLNQGKDEKRSVRSTQNWLQLVKQSLSAILFPKRKGASPRSATAVVATNIALVVTLLFIFFAFFPLIGIVRAETNGEYRDDLNLKSLKELAANYIRGDHIWFEPLAQGQTPGESCTGNDLVKNRAIQNALDPVIAYQLCIDDDVKGATEGDTIQQLIRQWNNRTKGRGNTLNQKLDDDQFFQLDVTQLQRAGYKYSEALTVNEGIYRWRSPFNSQSSWRGALTQAGLEAPSGGVMIGAGLVLPLRAVSAEDGNEPVFLGAATQRAGTSPYVRINLDDPKTPPPARGFAIYETAGQQRPIFEIETVKGAIGALLRPVTGDFELFLNGCPLIAGASGNCKMPSDSAGTSARGETQPLRLDEGDVLAYAPLDPHNPNKRIARYVFVYGQAEVGTYSYMTSINGRDQRVYPQGEAWPMAQQVVQAIDRSVSDSANAEGTANRSVALTLDAELNNAVYRLLRQWRACMHGNNPQRLACKQVPIKAGTQNMAVTLMDPTTGALLTLASDDDSPYNPNRNPSGINGEANLNLTRHLVGSAIKPFTSAATLRAFPELYNLTIVDRRTDHTKILGLPFGGKKQRPITGHSLEIPWANFLPHSDNLYAFTFSLLGMADARNASGMPRFDRQANVASPLRLELTDNGTSVGMPQWAAENMFNPSQPINPGGVARLELTPLAQGLESLFNVRAATPQTFSYDTSLWMPLKNMGLIENERIYNIVSPEITNFAFRDIDNFTDLRSVLLGGEFNDLSQYGKVGGAWSNVSLAESFARITTGHKVKAQIVVDASMPLQPVTEEWFEHMRDYDWRRALMGSLEGVAVRQGATAQPALADTLRTIEGAQPESVFGSGRTHFTIFCKTGTLDPDAEGDLLEDSVFVFTAGIWNDEASTFERPVTGAIYIQQGVEGQAQAFAGALLKLLDHNRRFNWSGRY